MEGRVDATKGLHGIQVVPRRDLCARLECSLCTKSFRLELSETCRAAGQKQTVCDDESSNFSCWTNNLCLHVIADLPFLLCVLPAPPVKTNHNIADVFGCLCVHSCMRVCVRV